MSKAAYLVILLFLSISLLFSEDTKFEGVKIRRHKSAEKRELVDKIGVLSFEDDGQKLTFRSGAGDQFAIPYSDITKVVFDTDTHGAAWIASVHVHDRWLYLEYRQGDHSEKVLLVLPRAIYDKATAKSQKSVWRMRDDCELSRKGGVDCRQGRRHGQEPYPGLEVQVFDQA